MILKDNSQLFYTWRAVAKRMASVRSRRIKSHDLLL